MLSIIYVSTVTAALGRLALDQLARQSATANAARRLTGMLACNSRNFLQLLEGGGQEVLETMARIERDPRHHSLSYIRQEQRALRECPDWQMRGMLVPLHGVDSATVFTRSLPASMELDTRILFTSFASALSPSATMRQLERAETGNEPPPRAND